MGSLRVAALLTVVLCASLGAASIAGSFADSNPNGDWSYGWTASLGGSFTPFPACGSPTSCGGSGYSSTEWIWWATQLSGVPVVYENVTGSDIDRDGVSMPVGWLIMHPDSSGGYSVVRYTVPATGVYVISGAFEGLDHLYQTSTDVHVLLNNTSLFDADVTHYYLFDGGYVPFSLTQSLSAGDQIDFAVGFGNRSYTGDSTGLQGDITSGVPEPSGLVLATAGVALIACLRRRRPRAGFGAE